MMNVEGKALSAVCRWKIIDPFHLYLLSIYCMHNTEGNSGKSKMNKTARTINLPDCNPAWG